MVVPLDKRPRSGPYSGINARSAKRFLTEQFRQAGIALAEEDARDLIMAVTGFSLTDFILRGTEFLSPEQFDLVKDYADRRLNDEPVDAILGWREFYGRRFTISPDVLSPRGDTEILVEQGLRAIRNIAHPRILDLGIGSGAVLLSILAENKKSMGVGVDVSEKALLIAKENADALGVANRAVLIQSDWFQHVQGLFDLIISNPPYITDAAMQALETDVKDYDPDLALRGGPDGLKPYPIILAQAPRFLKPGGACWVEIGYDQGPAVEHLFKHHGFKSVKVIQDLSGHDRCVGGILEAR